jgi:hypothetical protein
MDAKEIVKHAPELLKGGAALAGALKLTDVMKAMLGPATAEFAERVRDEVRLYRFGRQLELLKKAEKMAKVAGFTPKAVPIKLLFPLLEGASLEEDEELHTMWAALLVNASRPAARDQVRPGFIDVLRNLAPDEAMLLKSLHEAVTKHEAADGLFTGPQISALFSRFVSPVPILNGDGIAVGSVIDGSRIDVCLSGLQSHGLVERRYDRITVTFGAVDDQSTRTYSLTTRGFRFVSACQAPKPTSTSPTGPQERPSTPPQGS